MDLQKLREKTRPCHHKIESNVLLSKLMGPVTLPDYIEVLKKFYGFYLPLETVTIPSLLSQNSDFKKFHFAKLHLLKMDLDVFATASNELKSCRFTPNPTTPFGLLGVLYTLEGSCLGRAMMWPNIQRQLKLDSGGSFFGSATSDLKPHWAAFCKNMTEQVQSETEMEEVIEGAIATFVSLDEWFKQ